ncbi:MAG TPA: hypothetical protein VM912_04095, partial [Terriglobales bacterium]|nr:hypothetical protein [Terriglobales bacterium]
MATMSLKRIPALVLASVGPMLIIMTGCEVGPNYIRPQVTAPAVYRGADETSISGADQNYPGNQQWAKVFREPELQNLIRVALEDNYDLLIAAQRVLEE